MKRKSSVFVALLCAFVLIASTAMAKDTYGYTSGGVNGKAVGYAELTYKNEAGGGRDTGTAKTKSNTEESSNGTSVTIYYVKGSGSASNSASKSSSGTTWATATAKVDVSTGHGYKVSSGHTVTTNTYGSWSTSLSDSW